jgi:hypothetical protein
VDSAGNVYVLGKSTSTSLTIGSDSFTGASSSSEYTVLFKLDNGFNVQWAKQIGGVESGSTVRERGAITALGFIEWHACNVHNGFVS